MPGECADHERPRRARPRAEHRCAATLQYAGFRAVNAHAQSEMTSVRETSRRKPFAYLADPAPLPVVHPLLTGLNHPGCAVGVPQPPVALFSKESVAENDAQHDPP